MLNKKLRFFYGFLLLAFVTFFAWQAEAVTYEEFVKYCTELTPEEATRDYPPGSKNRLDDELNEHLMLMVRYNPHPEVITILLNAGANVNYMDESAATILMCAASFTRNPEIISILLQAGADANTEYEPDGSGAKALDFALENDALKNTEALLELRAATKDFFKDNDALQGTAELEELTTTSSITTLRDFYAIYPDIALLDVNSNEIKLLGKLFIEYIKQSYFSDFPPESGYENVGDAFDEFFSRPKWEFSIGVASGVGCYPIAYFTGVGRYQGSNALYKISCWARYYGVGPFNWTIDECTINGASVDAGEILAQIYLN